MDRPARLTASLLARKGEASPSGGFAAGGALAQPLASFARAASSRPVPATRRAFGLLADAPGERPFGAAAAGERVALTVRLDPARHRRLKILAARRRRTGQALLVEALDAYLRQCGAECACLRGEPDRCERN